MKKILITFLMCTSLLIYAQDSGTDDFFSDDVDFDDMDFDDMFGEEGDDSFIEVVEDQSDEIADPSSDLLTTNGVEWGGSFSSSISAGLTYTDFPEVDTFTDDDVQDDTFSADLSASLYFNARPTDDTRFYGKFSTEVPFYKSATVLLENEDYDGLQASYDGEGEVTFTGDTDEGTPTDFQVPDITIDELFSDFNYDNKLFFRVGKQNAKWGVGYFFSPADFLSLESIDPEDPTADREGPVAIKMNVPFGLNNFYAFITVPNSVFESGEASVTDLILAPMVQVLLGDTEVSSGIYFQQDSAPRAMVSATYGTNTNLGQLSYFGEGVVLYGSDKTFINDDYTTKTRDDEFFFNGTVGLMWSKTIAENDFSLAAQYYYNGEGYDSDSDVVSHLINSDFSGLNATQLINARTLGTNFLSGDSDLSYADLFNRNKHYLGFNFGISNLFDNEDLSISVFNIMNLVDISGYIMPSISYEFFDGLSTTFSTTFNLSDEGDEYYTDRFAFELSFNLGSGSF